MVGSISYYSKIAPEESTSYIFLYGYTVLCWTLKGHMYIMTEKSTEWERQI